MTSGRTRRIGFLVTLVIRWGLFLWLVALCDVPRVQGQVYMSVTSRGYTTTETGEPTFTCLRSSPDLDADVFTGRYVYTYNDINNPSNGPPPSAVSSIEGTRPSEVFTTRLDTTPHRSYGVFYCAGWKGGVWTAAPTIFLRSDATFVPTGKRFSKTVNAGDENVTVDFTEVEASDLVKNWRFNGTSDPNGVLVPSSSIYGQLTSYTIPGEVSVDNEGAYELHIPGERGQATAGLLRIIVRVCPAGRYNESGGCVQTCPSCYNGGVCHDETGHCLCPPGYRGDNCEIACGGNRYGRICEYRCDYDSDDGSACAGLQICLPDPYGCSCAPGYTGLDGMTECESGTFGASCTEQCHCVSDACDRFTGVCSGLSTACLPGWTGTNCQECVDGRYGPACDVLSLTIEKPNKGQAAFFECGLEGGRVVSTARPVVKLYRRMADESFHETDITRSGSSWNGSDFIASFLVTSVGDEETFFCAVSDVNNFRSIEIQADGEYIPPELPGPLVISAATNVSVSLVWDAWDETTDVGDPPLQRYRVYVKNQSSYWLEVERTDGLAPSETVTGLAPDTDYVFGVRAVRPGAGGGGSRVELEGQTNCSPPWEGPSAIVVANGTAAGQLFVSWQNPDVALSNCRSGFTSIRIYHTISNNAVGSSGSVDESSSCAHTDVPLSASSGYHVTGLEPFTRYVIHVVITNRDAESARGPGIQAFTLEEVAPPPVVSVEANSTCIEVRWDAALPDHLNGNVQGYQFSYHQVEPEVGDDVVVDIASNNLRDNVIVISEHIEEGNTYQVQVRVLNGVGYGAWSGIEQVETSDGVPGYNLALIVGSVVGGVVLMVIVLIVIGVVCSRARAGNSKASSQSATFQTPSPDKTSDDGHLYLSVDPPTDVYQDLNAPAPAPKGLKAPALHDEYVYDQPYTGVEEPYLVPIGQEEDTSGQ